MITKTGVKSTTERVNKFRIPGYEILETRAFLTLKHHGVQSGGAIFLVRIPLEDSTSYSPQPLGWGSAALDELRASRSRGTILMVFHRPALQTITLHKHLGIRLRM